MSEEKTEQAYVQYRKVRRVYRTVAAETHEKRVQMIAAKRLAEQLATEYENLNTKRFALSLTVEQAERDLQDALKEDWYPSEEASDEEAEGE